MYTMMFIEDATVVCNADGTIDPIQSYVMPQNQAADSGETFYAHTGEFKHPVAEAIMRDKLSCKEATPQFEVSVDTKVAS